MTPAVCSVHTHSTFCDGRDTMAAMAEAACAAGVRHFGVSGHIHTPCPGDVGVCMSADLTAYRAEALRLRQEYDGRMEVLLGVEWDSCSEQAVPDWADYWIGSVHNLRHPQTGGYYTVDWKLEELARCCVEWFHGDFQALLARYYADVAAVAAKKPTILGHIDLITKLNGDGGLFDETDRRYRALALAALHAADPAATVLEINTGAMARGYRTAPYPAAFLLAEWHAMGGQVVITADAHSADGVIYGYDAAEQLARQAGYEETQVLTVEGWKPCPLRGA